MKYSDEWFLSLYLMFGSVEEALKRYPENLPISAANYHRLVKKYGLVKSAGRHVSLPETLHFFREKALKPGRPLERIYRNMPPSFQTSLSTLHRIYQFMEKKLVRRRAAAVIITAGDKGRILIGREVFGNSRYGKRVGDVSIPMSFAKKDEMAVDSVLRVLQQEVFSEIAAKGALKKNSELTKSIMPENIEPLFYFDIVDVRVSVFLLGEVKVDMFSSHKLIDHRFESTSLITNRGDVRAGVAEIVRLYEDYLYKPYTVEFPRFYVSEINTKAVAPNLKLA